MTGKVKVPLFGAPQRCTTIDFGATAGATFGVDFRWPDGTLVTTADFAPAPVDPGSDLAQTIWRLVLEIPPNVTALEEAVGTGLFAVTGDGTGAMRAIGSTTLAVTNGDGVAGDPAVDLAELPDTGIGAALVKQTRDEFGRVEGTESATTDDLSEGVTNLYFTAARVRETVLTGLSLASSAVISATDTVLSALGKLQGQITALATSVSGLITQTITNGDTTHAPSGDAVFDALELRKSGIYTPTCTGIFNVSACSGNTCNWSRAGGGFVVSGSVQVTPTASNAAVTVQLSLPLTTAFTDNLNCSGPASGKAAGVPSYEVGQVLASAGTGNLQLNFYPATTNNYTMRFCVVVPII